VAEKSSITADEATQDVGRVLRSSTAQFTVGCQQLIADPEQLTPRLGALITASSATTDVYGLICNVTIEDDAFVRQLVAAGVESEEIIEDQRQKRQVPVVIEVQIVGYRAGERVLQRLPPQPPRTLDPTRTCTRAEVRRFTRDHEWLRLLLSAPDIGSSDQIIVAALLAAAEARPSLIERETYLLEAGRELARLLTLDLTRLEGILRQLRPQTA
jgi:hypothetical protein